MKTTTKTILAVLALGASALIANAQDAGGPPDGQRPPQHGDSGNGPQRMGGRRPPPSPLMEALDANHDGIIDSNEIANASAALKKLDKNGDGKLTPDELRPQRPQRGEGQDRPPRGDSQDHPPGSDGQQSQHPPGDN